MAAEKYKNRNRITLEDARTETRRPIWTQETQAAQEVLVLTQETLVLDLAQETLALD